MCASKLAPFPCVCALFYHWSLGNLTIIHSHLSKLYLVTACKVEHMYNYVHATHVHGEESPTLHNLPLPRHFVFDCTSALMWLQPYLDWLLTREFKIFPLSGVTVQVVSTVPVMFSYWVCMWKELCFEICHAIHVDL